MQLRALLFLLLLPAVGPGATVDLSILVTTDLHGNLYPYDYFTAKAAPRGLAAVATLIREQRAAHPHSLLIDCGDTIQGSPLEGTYQLALAAGKTKAADPMMVAMNALGFDAMTLGNHELNYGLANLEHAREAARFPWLSANTRIEDGAKVRPFEPYLVRTVAGVKIAIIGITTPSIPLWEKPENYQGYRWIPGEQAVREAVAELKSRHRPDVILVAAHAGLDRDPKTGKSFAGAVPGENMVYQIASGVDGVDAIVFGHTHRQLEGVRIGTVELLQPLNWGGQLGRLDLTLEGEPGRWTVTKKSGTLIPVTAQTAADPEILRLARPYHEAAEAELTTPVATAPAALDARDSRERDNALIDAIQMVQLHYAQADVSFAAAFNLNLKVAQGPVTVRELAALYVYDNELYAIAGTGAMVKEALENAARFYLPCPAEGCGGKPRFNSSVMGFNYDMAQGVTYEIDPSRPEGDRVRNLRYHGEPLQPDRPLRIAVNNYRYGGSAGYTMFRGARILWQSNRPIRDLMVEYFQERKQLPSAPDGNWKLILR